ncbi:MAG: hypothetical protein UHP28_04975 [Treponema sp.]|nr:hypothetical protein [Treponema sp.]
MKKTLAFIFIFCYGFISFAQNGKSLRAIGFGPSKDKARSEALDSLVQNLWTDVRSESNISILDEVSSKKSKGKSKTTFLESVKVSSSLPVIGAKYDYEEVKDSKGHSEWKATVTLSSKTSLESYKDEISKKAELINGLWQSESKLSESKKDQIFSSLAKAYSEYEKFVYVAKLLGALDFALPVKTPVEFHVIEQERAKRTTSLDKAASDIVESIKSSLGNTYVSPAFYEDSKSTTPFSVALASRIKSAVGNKLSISKAAAKTFLQGSYYFEEGGADGDDICVSYYLCDGEGNVLGAASIVRIPFSVYGTMKFIPSNYDLAKEIQSGRVSSPDFNVSVRINGSRTPADFKRGDSLEIEVRATQSCYIYIVGYVYNELGEEFAYLFPLDITESGKEMFVRRISSSEVNKWVIVNPVGEGGEIMNIDVIAPFGEETLQVYAVTAADPSSVYEQIPDYRETDDYYLLAGNPLEASSKTRALAVKKAAQNAAKKHLFADSSVSYTSHE